MKDRLLLHPDINLHVKARISADDACRQTRTAREVLKRLRSQPGVVLADEVGMGKTFVGLAVAYSVIEHMFNERAELELERCYQKVLIITPQNSALYSKWLREVSEFVKRCVLPKYRDEAMKWFAPTAVERIDELSAELRRAGSGSRIIVANMSIFSGGKLRNYDLKRRFLLGILFRYWAATIAAVLLPPTITGTPKYSKNFF